MSWYETEKIRTKEDFIFFLKSLRKDYSEDLPSWENTDIDSFLEAMAAWVEDMDAVYINNNLPIPKNPNWSVFADILMGAKYQE